MDPTLDLVLRLLVAGLIGGMVGLEREVRGRDPGVRTHALVALGAALFTIAGAYGFGDISRSTNVDPARIAAQVATGIGFIGAGAIIRSGFSVRGLTTAATLWMSAALGVTVGAGAYVPALAATLTAFAILVGFGLAKPLILNRLGPQPVTLRLEYERGHGTLGPVLQQLEKADLRLTELRLEDEDLVDGPDGTLRLRRATIEVRARDERTLSAIVHALGRRGEMRSISLEPA